MEGRILAGYTREFLVNAYADKYRHCFKTEDEFFEFKCNLGYDFYDRVGKDKFRVYASLDAEAIRKYKESLK